VVTVCRLVVVSDIVLPVVMVKVVVCMLVVVPVVEVSVVVCGLVVEVLVSSQAYSAQKVYLQPLASV
jgi:hypothetical protein